MALRWEDLLVVANCKIHWKEFANHQVYLCPATPEGFDPKYIHERAKFFAPYVSQGAKYVAQIDGVVRVKSRTDAEILWNNTEEPDLILIAQAFEKLKEAFSYKPPCLVFLLSELKATDLVYDQRGALLSSRQYFDISSLNASTSGELAQKLREVPWSVLPKHTPEKITPAQAEKALIAAEKAADKASAAVEKAEAKANAAAEKAAGKASAAAEKAANKASASAAKSSS